MFHKFALHPEPVAKVPCLDLWVVHKLRSAAFLEEPPVVDHVGAVETDSDGLFKNATLYLSEIENRYLTGEKRRKVIFGLYKLPMVKSDNRRVLLQDGQILNIGSIRVECILVPGHTWGHMVYLIDNEYLFTGDTIWFGADGGYSFINSLAEDNELAKKSLAELEQKLKRKGLSPKVITGHTGWTDDFEFVRMLPMMAMSRTTIQNRMQEAVFCTRWFL